MKRKSLRIITIAIIAFLAFYIILVNALLSAALKPSFMNNLDWVVNDITQKNAALMVKSDSLTETRNSMIEERDAWLEENEGTNVYINSNDGYKLVARQFLTNQHSENWVILLHGYTGYKEESYIFCPWYSKNGYNILAPDFRAEGESEGDYIGMGYLESMDNIGWIDYILSVDPNARIAIHGQSMGATTAIMTSALEDISPHVFAIIADCGYTDAMSMFSHKITDWFSLPSFPIIDTARIMLLMRGQYDIKDASALEAIKKSSIPTLIIHGSEDKFVPVYMAEQLYEAASCPKKLLIIENAGHGQSKYADSDTYFSTVGDWLDTYQ